VQFDLQLQRYELGSAGFEVIGRTEVQPRRNEVKVLCVYVVPQERSDPVQLWLMSMGTDSGIVN
jgi:hypothetical protein